MGFYARLIVIFTKSRLLLFISSLWSLIHQIVLGFLVYATFDYASVKTYWFRILRKFTLVVYKNRVIGSVLIWILLV